MIRLSNTLCETDSVLLQAVDKFQLCISSVYKYSGEGSLVYSHVSPEESVTNNPEVAYAGWHVEAEEGRNTCALNLKDVILGAQCVVPAGELECNGRKRITLGTR